MTQLKESCYEKISIEDEGFESCAKSHLEVVYLTALLNLNRIKENSGVSYVDNKFYLNSEYKIKYPLKHFVNKLYQMIENQYDVELEVKETKDNLFRYNTEESNVIYCNTFDKELFEEILRLLNFGFIYKHDTEVNNKDQARIYHMYSIHPPKHDNKNTFYYFNQITTDVDVLGYLYQEMLDHNSGKKHSPNINYLLIGERGSIKIHKFVMNAYVSKCHKDNMIKIFFKTDLSADSKNDCFKFSDYSLDTIKYFVEYLYFGPTCFDSYKSYRGAGANTIKMTRDEKEIKYETIIELFKFADYIGSKELFEALVKLCLPEGKYYSILMMYNERYPVIKEKISTQTETEFRLNHIKLRLLKFSCHGDLCTSIHNNLVSHSYNMIEDEYVGKSEVDGNKYKFIINNKSIELITKCKQGGGSTQLEEEIRKKSCSLSVKDYFVLHYNL